MARQIVFFILLAVAVAANARLLTGQTGGPDQLNPVIDGVIYKEINPLDLASLGLSSFYKGNISTGYITANATSGSKTFYTLYTANGLINASKLEDYPLILWLQGGPGCSDWSGQLTEIGPIKIINSTNAKNETIQIPVPQTPNWNTGYNLLFIDNPVGVGLSVGTDNVNSADMAAEYIYTFLQRFFQLYKQLVPQKFYIFAESFGGHYGPAIASKILREKANNTINFQGLGIVDGWVQPFWQGSSYSEYAYAAGLADPNLRAQMAQNESLLQQQYQGGQKVDVANSFNTISTYLLYQNFNVYDYRFYPNPNLVDPYALWLQNATTKQLLGVDSRVYFNDCVDSSYTAFLADIGTSYADHYEYVLSHPANISVLIMNGADDFIVNVPGTSKWVKKLDWPGAAAFRSTPKTVWFADKAGTEAWGSFQHNQQLTYAVVYKAGHEVPTFAPPSARNLLDRFTAGNWSSGYGN